MLDTNSLLWWNDENPKLGSVARGVIADLENQIYVSAVSSYEMAYKRFQGKLEAPENIEDLVADMGFSRLPISSLHAEQAGRLPWHHRDPFDRILVAQAQAEALVLITGDAVILRYNVNTLAAGR